MSINYQSGPLPSISNMANSPVKMEHSETQPRRPHLPSLSIASSAYPNVDSSMPRPRSTMPNSGATSVAFLTSSSDFRKLGMDGQEGLGAVAGSSTRLSLPSISEALANGSGAAPSSATSSQYSYPQRSPSSPRFTWNQTGTDPDQSFHARRRSQEYPSGRAPYVGRIEPATPPHAQHSHIPRSYTPKSHAYENGNSSLPQAQTYAPPRSPRPSSPRSSIGQPWAHPLSASYEVHQRAPKLGTPHHAYAQYPPHPYTAPPPVTSMAVPDYAAPSQYSIPSQHAPAWQPADVHHSDVLPKVREYSESVKICLDEFDLETALSEVAANAHQLFEFSQHYSQKAHQAQTSGPQPGSIPNIIEVDDMIRNGGRISDSLLRLRDVIVSQQAAFERSQEPSMNKAGKHPVPIDDSQDVLRDGSYGGSDNKKRRGRAAPPGRCHSCNRAETPEWRRGPDGARTLCNACGLHYAKLTRKMGASKQPLGSSQLRPKSMGNSSP